MRVDAKVCKKCGDRQKRTGYWKASKVVCWGDYCLLLSFSVCVEEEDSAVSIRLSYLCEGSKTLELALVDAKNYKSEQ